MLGILAVLSHIKTLTLLPDTSSETCQPGMRGGHQMCIDTERQIIYLMGGWDGSDDLADFWMFDINQKSWRMISRDTEQDGGPCARSCHKLCLDHKRKLIFMLGRYLDSEVRSTMSLKVYSIQQKRKSDWVKPIFHSATLFARRGAKTRIR